MVDSRYIQLATNVREAIAEVQDFPKVGIGFKDLTTVLLRPELYRGIVSWIVDRAKDYERRYGKIDKVVAVESRGYWFGCPVAVELNAGFVPIRKPGKLPRSTTSIESRKEYGGDVLHIHTGDILPSDRVILVDDLLATGGTVDAACDLTKQFLEEQRGGKLLAVFTPVELRFLNGRKNVRDPLESLVVYD